MTDPEILATLRRNVETASRFICALLVYKRTEQSAANWLTGGTCTLVRTPEARFLLTADHVMQEVEEHRSRYPLAMFLGGSGRPVDISLWPTIDGDSLVDLHTIAVPNDFDSSVINKEFLEIKEWPVPRASAGDAAFVIGYPAAHRRGTRASVGLRIAHISDFVTDVGPRKFTMADERNEREVLLNPDNLLIPEHMGGMSGSPAFRAAPDGRATLVGVLSGGGDGLRGPHFLSHADFLLAEGRIDRLRLPPM